MGGQGVVRHVEAAGDLAGRHALLAGFHEQAEGAHARLLPEGIHGFYGSN